MPTLSWLLTGWSRKHSRNRHTSVWPNQDGNKQLLAGHALGITFALFRSLLVHSSWLPGLFLEAGDVKIKRQKGVALPQAYWSPIIIQTLRCPPSPDKDRQFPTHGEFIITCSLLKYTKTFTRAPHLNSKSHWGSFHLLNHFTLLSNNCPHLLSILWII